MNITTADHPVDRPPANPKAFGVYCPLCHADVGELCQEVIVGRVRTVGPHLTRIAAAVDPQRAGGAR